MFYRLKPLTDSHSRDFSDLRKPQAKGSNPDGQAEVTASESPLRQAIQLIGDMGSVWPEIG